jgi:hypothetical protein
MLMQRRREARDSQRVRLWPPPRCAAALGLTYWPTQWEKARERGSSVDPETERVAAPHRGRRGGSSGRRYVFFKCDHITEYFTNLMLF